MSLVPQMQFSHVGITVTDFDKMLDFYTRVLGFAVSDLGEAARNGLKMAFITRDPAEHHQIVLAPSRPADAPYSFALDLSMSDDEIFAYTREKLKSLPGYQPRTEWIDQAAARMMEDGVWSGEWGR